MRRRGFFYVVGFNADFKEGRKTLVEVARSMDPASTKRS